MQEELKFPEDYTLAEELQEAVYQALRSLWRSQERKGWQASWATVLESYERRTSRVCSTANEHRRWLMREHGCTEEQANALVAKAVAEVVRQRRQRSLP